MSLMKEIKNGTRRIYITRYRQYCRLDTTVLTSLEAAQKFVEGPILDFTHYRVDGYQEPDGTVIDEKNSPEFRKLCSLVLGKTK